jgi:predicted RNA-binding Zn ribbon-like protein
VKADPESGTRSQSDDRFLFVGNSLCLDFVNTEVIGRGGRVDLLVDFDGLAAWCVDAGILDADRARRIRADWSGTSEADKAFGRALEIRAALRDMADRIASGRPIPPNHVDTINRALRERDGRIELVQIDDRFEKRFQMTFGAPQQLVVPVAEAAADLLSTGDLTLVRKCENPDCILYFYDVTKNHARRWCSMASCGNRAKATAHYRRKRGSTATE